MLEVEEIRPSQKGEPTTLWPALASLQTLSGPVRPKQVTKHRPVLEAQPVKRMQLFIDVRDERLTHLLHL